MSSRQSLHDLVFAVAGRDPRAVALLSGSRPPMTYEGLREQTSATVVALRRAGVGAQDRVAMLMPDGPEMAAALVGVLTGAVGAPLNPTYTAEELRFFLADLDAAALLLPAGDKGPARTVAGELGVQCLDVSSESGWPAGRFALTGGEASKPCGDALPGADDVALVLHTSGTTARPKRVPLTQANLAASARNTGATLQLVPQDRSLIVMPLFHIHAIAGALLSSLTSGASVVCASGFNAPSFLDWLEEYQPTWYTAVPAIHQAILARAEGRRASLRHCLRVVRSSSSALPPPVMAALEAMFGVPVIEAYGMTEAAHQVASNPLPPGVRKPGSVGPAVGTDIAVMDPSGRVLPSGDTGEIAIRGANVTRGYESIAASAAAPGDGWFRTGDEGHLDAEGYLRISGRLKEIINRGGEKISPREVDDILLAHPQVMQAVAFAVPDARLGEDVGAVIVTRPGAVVTRTELREFVAARLASFKVPRLLLFREAIPVGPSGKVRRIGLAQALGIGLAPAAANEPVPRWVAPRTATEEAVASIWKDLLRVPRVGVHDHFLDLGGDSILAAQMASRIAETFEHPFSFVDFLEFPTVAQCASVLDRAAGDGTRTRSSVITPRARTGDLPLSSAQRRLWFLDQLDTGDAVYNRPVLLRITGALDEAVLEGVLAALVQRHESLRTVFRTRDGVPYQVVLERAPVPLVRRAVDELLAETRLPFDLARGPLLRASLAKAGPQEHLLLMALHHIVFDEWSERVLLGELAALYTRLSGGTAELPDLPVQPADIALRESERLAGAGPQADVAYWRERLSGATVAEVRPDYPRPTRQTHVGARIVHTMASGGLSASLRSQSRKEGVTLFTLLLAGFQVLLGRHAGESDVVVGTPAHLRNDRATEKLIGVFVNTLVLRTSLDGNPTVRALLARTRVTVQEAIAHQDLPFERLVSALAPPRDLSRTPLFQAMFQLRHAEGSFVESGGLRLATEPLPRSVAQFDFRVEVIDDGQALAFACDYNTDLFAPETIIELLRHYETLLAAMVADPGRPISELPILDDEERATVAFANQRTSLDVAAKRRLHHYFEAQAARTPDAPAAIFEGAAITYAELNRRADELAGRLRERGVDSDCTVGIALGRSFEMLIVVLGILKSGGACVPLDPDYPRQRLDFMIAEAGVRLVLTGELLPASARLDPADVGVDPLAYVIFTSGSTGRPKAVAMGHAPLCNLVGWQLRQPGFGAGRKTLQFASLSFDVAFQEMFATWGSGGALVLVPEPVRRDLPRLWRIVESEAVERLFLPFVALRAFAEIAEAEGRYPASLREVITAGEQLQITAPVRRLFERLSACTLENQYGPAETHVATSYRLEGPVAAWPTLPPIGRPIANAKILILDTHRRLVPTGVPGELCIGGPVLSRGYLGQPALTAERYCADPYSAEAGARLYRTGDLARSLRTGEIEFLGRADQQVKIRGYRVEPGEVEALLCRHPAVSSAVVTARDSRLTAYVTLHGGQQPADDEWVSFLGEFLPEPMVPSAFVVLDALPLLPSGKVDRRTLPEPDLARSGRRSLSGAPATALERMLAAIWCDVLKVAAIGVDENFFDLGGHSLAVVNVHNRLQEHFRREVSVIDLFRHSTIRSLARHMEAREAAVDNTAVVDERARKQRAAFGRQRQRRG